MANCSKPSGLSTTCSLSQVLWVRPQLASWALHFRLSGGHGPLQAQLGQDLRPHSHGHGHDSGSVGCWTEGLSATSAGFVTMQWRLASKQAGDPALSHTFLEGTSVAQFCLETSPGPVHNPQRDLRRCKCRRQDHGASRRAGADPGVHCGGRGDADAGQRIKGRRSTGWEGKPPTQAGGCAPSHPAQHLALKQPSCPRVTGLGSRWLGNPWSLRTEGGGRGSQADLPGGRGHVAFWPPGPTVHVVSPAHSSMWMQSFPASPDPRSPCSPRAGGTFSRLLQDGYRANSPKTWWLEQAGVRLGSWCALVSFLVGCGGHCPDPGRHGRRSQVRLWGY